MAKEPMPGMSGTHMIGVRMDCNTLAKMNDRVGMNKQFPSWSHMIRTAIVEYLKNHPETEEPKSSTPSREVSQTTLSSA